MKKLLTLFLLTTSWMACSNDNRSEKVKTTNAAATAHHENTTNKKGLVLNDGAKWKADSITNINVKSLLNRIETFNSGADRSLSAYATVSNDLQQGLNKMISDCKMQGEEHEALHGWLQPVIEQVSKLKDASTTVDAATILAVIHRQVNLYQQYFE